MGAQQREPQRQHGVVGKDRHRGPAGGGQGRRQLGVVLLGGHEGALCAGQLELAHERVSERLAVTEDEDRSVWRQRSSRHCTGRDRHRERR